MDDQIDYITKHYVSVSSTSAALKWVPCGPDCTHPRQSDVPGGDLVSVILSGDQILWAYGDDDDT